jgi:hypothetical protein
LIELPDVFSHFSSPPHKLFQALLLLFCARSTTSRTRGEEHHQIHDSGIPTPLKSTGEEDDDPELVEKM